MAGFAGCIEGHELKSLYRLVFRVRCEAYSGGRMRSVDQLVTAMDVYHARERAQRMYDVRGSLVVERVGELEPVQ